MVRLSKGAFRPRPAVRNGAVGLLVAMALFGGMCAAGWFEPFSLFGRTQLVQQQQLDLLGNETGWLPFSAPRPAVPWLVTVAGELLLAAVVFLWMASPIMAHLIANTEILTERNMDADDENDEEGELLL